MVYLTSVLYFVLNFFNQFAKSKKKWIPFLSFVLIWLIIGFNGDNPDYVNYQNIYLLEQSNDFGFTLLVKMGKLFNFEYMTFLATVIFICVTMIKRTVEKFVENSSYVLILYFLYPLFIDVIQVRNFIVMSILVVAFSFLLDEDYKKGNFKFILAILIGATFQVTILIYLPFIFFKNGMNSKATRIVMFFMITLAIVFGLNKSLLNSVGLILLSFVNQNRFLASFQVQTNYGFLWLWLIQIMSFFLVWVAFKKINENFKSRYSKVSRNQQKISLLIVNISAYAFLFLPFYVYTVNFSRFIRNLFILYYIIFAIYNKVQKPRSIGKLVFNLLVIILLSITINFELGYNGGFTRIIIPMFENNLILVN